MQYDVQIDVVMQLEERVQQQLNSAQSSAPQIVKLTRDFDRVKARVIFFKAEAEKLERQAIAGAGTYAGASSSAAQNVDSADSYQQVQLQMHQDVSIC